MKENPIEKGRLSEHGEGLGLVTEEIVRKRAREIAVINGRGANRMLDSDLAEARRELQGEERLNPTPTAAEELTEEERWEPVAESEGHRGVTVPPPDEQSVPEKLVEEGVEDAEHDQALEAVREARRREKE